MDPLLTDHEFAGLLRRPAWWVKQQRNRGWGPVYVRVGRSIRYRREDVDKWLESQLESRPTITSIDRHGDSEAARSNAAPLVGVDERPVNQRSSTDAIARERALLAAEGSALEE